MRPAWLLAVGVGLCRWARRPSTSAVGVEQGGEGARVHFADGSDSQADLLIASGGIKSTLRGAVLRQRGHAPVAPRFTGPYA
ncbi:hypothetical protein XaplCFBP3123_17200 [Xanthomonas arboricola pv. populi]|nr:hypothetical protein XaplCFBP3123_17200 [Xanthomonas arboricola pv. populi]